MFVDASFLVALLDGRDRWHEQAKRAAPRLLKSRPWRTHAMALGEVVAVIGSRAGGRAARDAYHAVRDTVEVWVPTLDELDAALPHVVRYDGALSLSDALFVEAAKRGRALEILSFDADFAKAGLQCLPNAE